MRRGLVASLPVLLAVGLYAFFAASDPTPTTYRTAGLVARALAAIGCFIGAAQFDRGDYMRKAWGLLGTAYFVFFLNALIFGAVSHGAQREISSAMAITSGLIVWAGNIATVVGAVMVARAWKAAGLNLMVKPGTRLAVTVISIAIGLLVAGPAAVAALRGLADGQLDSLVRLAACVGDIVTLGVLGPILLTALALRGGSLAWPWSMIVVGTLGWLLYDGVVSVMTLLQYDRGQVRSLEEALRLFACGSFLAAGILQRMVVHQSAAPSASPAPSA